MPVATNVTAEDEVGEDGGRWRRALEKGAGEGRWRRALEKGAGEGRWRRTLDAGDWTLDAGDWTLDAGRWTLGRRHGGNLYAPDYSRFKVAMGTQKTPRRGAASHSVLAGRRQLGGNRETNEIG
ncbi:hypothetical protein E2P81_ATG07772 [Venturia nashicola]|nr:hypothetical protein E2P81_ATG07772 [Venturia nashicola]